MITELEHHSNYVPWHYLRKSKGIKIEFAEVNEDGEVTLESIEKKIEGNAIVLEKSTTIIVPREWSILPTKGDHLIMERNSK